MKLKRKRAGEYEFTNKHGFKGLILKQPEGGWSVYHIETSSTYDYGPTYAWAKESAREAFHYTGNRR
jgi:hypothetical protein